MFIQTPQSAFSLAREQTCVNFRISKFTERFAMRKSKLNTLVIITAL